MSDDIAIPADFSGDGRAELIVSRKGTWYILNLANNQFIVVQISLATDKPVPADYDGYGIANLAVYREGGWFILKSGSGFSAV